MSEATKRKLPSIQLPLITKTFRLQDASFNSDIIAVKEDIKKIKETQAEHTATLATILEQNQKIAEILLDTNALLKRSLGLSGTKYESMFPLKKEESILTIEKNLYTEDKLEILALIKKLVNGSLKFNFNKIFHDIVILDFNYDGIKGKKPLKRFKNLINAIFDASLMKNMPDFISEFKSCLKCNKNRINKANNRTKLSYENSFEEIYFDQ